jgi:hypothetical protein
MSFPPKMGMQQNMEWAANSVNGQPILTDTISLDAHYQNLEPLSVD